MRGKLAMLIISFLLLAGGYLLGSYSHKKSDSVLLPNLNLKGPVKSPLLDSLITYKIPDGWKKVANPDTPQFIELRSPNFNSKYDPFFTGAEIIISNSGEIPKNSLLENIISDSQIEGGVKVSLTKAQVGNMQAINAFVCFEGCTDFYYFEKNNYVWNVSFSCSPDCDTKVQIDQSRYAKDRDDFLKSIVFK